MVVLFAVLTLLFVVVVFQLLVYKKNLHQKQYRKRDTDVQNRLLDSVGEGGGWDVSREQHPNMYII